MRKKHSKHALEGETLPAEMNNVIKKLRNESYVDDKVFYVKPHSIKMIDIAKVNRV